MKKAARKTSAVKQAKKAKKSKTAKKAKKPAKTKPAPASAAKGEIQDGVVEKQPQVKEQAAVAQAMFLYTNDAWAQRYYDQNDLHFLEREVFG
jgi:hypothetical protein